MSDRSAIEWTDATWNPVRARDRKTGKLGWHCEHVTEACRFCYAEDFNHRLGTGRAFKPGHRDDLEIFLDDEMLLAPLKWRKPRMVFVCSMTDLFGEWVTDAWLDRIFAVMALCRQHTFQVLTKRPERMRAYLTRLSRHTINGHIWSLLGTPTGSKIKHGGEWQIQGLPLSNLWLLVSCGDHADADKFIPMLLDTPAAVRGVSLEPLLGAIDLTEMPSIFGGEERPLLRCNALKGKHSCGPAFVEYAKLDWVIVGGESGRHARPMNPVWARSLRDQCAAAGVPFFFKQWGEWAPHMGSIRDRARVEPDRITYHNFASAGRREAQVYKIGKKRAGRLLDGVEHNGFPEARP